MNSFYWSTLNGMDVPVETYGFQPFFLLSNIDNFGSTKRGFFVSFLKSLKVTTPSELGKPSLTVWAVSMFNSKRLNNGGLIKFNRFDVFPKQTPIPNGADCKRHLFQIKSLTCSYFFFVDYNYVLYKARGTCILDFRQLFFKSW